jgi:signal recognition particle GTPase
VIAREAPDSDLEVLLVLDATTGQNALNQAREFKEAAALQASCSPAGRYGARGVVIGIKNELQVPIKYVGVGEAIDDLQPFTPMPLPRRVWQRRHSTVAATALAVLLQRKAFFTEERPLRCRR